MVETRVFLPWNCLRGNIRSQKRYSVRGKKNTRKCMKSSEHNWELSGTATSLNFFFLNPFPSAKSFQFMNFSEAMFYENYLTSDSQTKHCYFKMCLPTRQNGVENRDKAFCAIIF